MIKIAVNLFTVLTIVFSLSSCIEQTSDTTYQVLGVGRSTPAKTILTQDGYLITSAEIERISDLTADDCFRLEFKTEEYGTNSDEVYNVKMLHIDTIKNYSLSPVFTDTTVLLENEEFLSSVNVKRSVYIDDFLFVGTQHRLYLENENEIFGLFYNSEEALESDGVENRVYDLFLRAFKLGGGDTLSRKFVYTTAFDIGQLVGQISPIEQAAGKDKIPFRIKYASKYDEALEQMSWAVSDTIFIKIK